MVKIQGKKKLESQFLEQKPSLMISYTEDKRLEMDFDALRENLWFTDSVAINVCERCAKWQESLCLLASARNAGLLQYAISYNAAISACVKGEQWQQAVDLFVAGQSVVLLPDVILCNASISACEKREQWQQALGLSGSPDV